VSISVFYFLPLLVLVLSSCATYNPVREFSSGLEAFPEGGVVISGVPDIDRVGRRDGLAALQPLLVFWGRPRLGNSSFHNADADGIIPVEEMMASVSEAHDLWTFSFYGTIEEIETRLSAGIPVLVMVQDDPMKVDSRRYLIVTGFNRSDQKFLALEGGPYPGLYTYPAFRRIWRPVRNWMMVACPPEKVSWELRTREHIALARYRERRGDWDVALQSYEQADAMEPNNIDIKLARAKAMYQSGDTLGAVVHFRRILDHDAFSAPAANNLAYILIETGGSLAESERLVRRALTIEPSNPLYLDTLGLILLKAGKAHEAATTLSRARHRSDVMPLDEQREITERLIEAYLDSNQAHLALQTWMDQIRRDTGFQLSDALMKRIEP